MSPEAEVSHVGSRQVRSIRTVGLQVLLLLNRKAGAGRWRKVVDQAVAALNEQGLNVIQTTDLAELAEHARVLWEAGQLRGVVSAGGDGTISAALNATPLGTPLAVLPLGTENLLARYLNHRCTPAGLAQLLTEGVVVPLDAARADDRLFALVFSAGLDAEVVRRVHEQRSGNITHLAYAGPLLKAVRQYRYPRVRVTWTSATGEQKSADGCWSFAVNLPSYALQLPLAPQAAGTDGQLDLCLMQRGSLASGMWYLWHVIRRRHTRLPTVCTARSPTFRFEPAGDEPVPYQIDGDPGGWLPVEVAVVPERMHLVVMPDVARRLGFSAAATRD